MKTQETYENHPHVQIFVAEEWQNDGEKIFEHKNKWN